MSEPIYRNPAVAILRTREDYIKQVRTHLAKSAENAFEAGKVLLEARAKLDRPQFLEMLQDQDFPVSESTAYRLMEVAGNEVLLSFAHAQKLPTSWYSLYELGKLQAKLPAPRFQKLIEDGTINPKMERKDIARLQPKKRPATPADPKGRTSNTTDTPIRMDAHDRLRHDQNRLVALYLKDAIKYREYREIDAYITQQVQEQAERKQLFGDMRGTEEETPRPPTADLPVVTI